MQLNIYDLTLKCIGIINNNLPAALHYFDDNWHRYLLEGTSTFDFSVNKSHPDYALLTMQGYISFTYDDEDYLFKIVNLRQDHFSIQVQCENLNFELIKEEVGACKNTKRHSIVWYLKNAAKITDNVLEIGNNPFSEVDEDKNNPVLNFDSTETKLARILSICNSFNAEFLFKTKLKNDGTFQNLTLDLYKKDGVGQKRKDVILYYGKNIDGITSTGDLTATFFNAATVTDSNNKYNWLAVEGKHYNDEGQLEFYKNAGENTAYAPLSRDMFPSQLKSSSSDRYTRKDLSTEATSANSLWDYAVSQFKLYAYPQMTYEVTVAVNAVTNALGNDRKLDIGDRVTIQDKTFDQTEGGLILSARVTEQEISFTNPLNNKITFSNFVKLKSEISADLMSRVEEIAKENAPYHAEIETSNGVQFKNGKGSTTLSAHVYQGSASTETIADTYEWTKDGESVANAQEITVEASGFSDKVVYAYQAILNGKVIGSASVTLTNVKDGTDGKAGKDGRSVVSIEQKYQVTLTDTKPTEPWEDKRWQIVEPKMTATYKYLWSMTRLTFNQAPFTQDTVEKKAVYGDSGKTGADGKPGKIVSDTEPTTKFKGLTWKYSGLTAIDASDGTNIQPNTEYYWNGKNWELNIITAHNIQAESLESLTGKMGDLETGSVTNKIDFATTTGKPIHYQGTSVLNDKGYKIDANMSDLETGISRGEKLISLDVEGGLFISDGSNSIALTSGYMVKPTLLINGNDILDMIWPIGSVYTSYENKNPADLFGIGVWTRIKGRFIVGVDEADTSISSAGKTGGEKNHTLTTDEMPKHGVQESVGIKNASSEAKGYGLTQAAAFKDRVIINNSGKPTYTGSAGGGKAHNNMPPYIALYMWRRTG
ncbi:phage baseplate protein [Lactococcus lactis]|uniref:Baseplate structural protein Gp10 C-terminal domain-containing protein n=2 Tax=Lactococcus lactis TaxID=1358 RepID=A0AAW5TLV6_9LACT|nr:hypothetical protein [Lactococcus lactis]MCW2281425.1 hypothetical protein [Lactococcus lactis]MCW2282169.1 hypothetical protein [Lactococcus lactis]